MTGLSRHASVRLQQRSIPPTVVDWLLKYGSSVRQDGAEIIIFDRAAKKRLAREMGRALVPRLGKMLDAYVVISNDGRVVTAGYRRRRIRRR